MKARNVQRLIEEVFLGMRVRSKRQLVAGSIALVMIVIASLWAINFIFPSNQANFEYVVAAAASFGSLPFVGYELEALLDRIGTRKTK